MATQLQFRRYTADEIEGLVGLEGEIFVLMNDADRWSLRLQDGVTPGGKLLSNDIADLYGIISDNPIFISTLAAKLDTTVYTSHIAGAIDKHHAIDISFEEDASYAERPLSDNVDWHINNLYSTKANISDFVSIYSSSQSIYSSGDVHLALVPGTGSNTAWFEIGRADTTNDLAGGIILWGKESTEFHIGTVEFPATDGQWLCLGTGLYGAGVCINDTNEVTLPQNVIAEKNLEVQGSLTAGNMQGGSVAIGDDVGSVTVTGLDLASVPISVIATVRKPSAGDYDMSVTIDGSSITVDGFTAYFSGDTDSPNYKLDFWLFTA